MGIQLKHKGAWWTTMGLTRSNLVSTFVTAYSFTFLGIVLVVLAVIATFNRHELSLHLLAGAACAFLLAIVVLLATVASLLFYIGEAVIHSSEEKPQRAS